MKDIVDDTILSSVAGPRIPFSREIYTGAELTTRSSRPGAYDAMAIPSLFNGRQSAPGAQKVLEAPRYVPPAPAVQPSAPATPTFHATTGHADFLPGDTNDRRFMAVELGPGRNQFKLRALTPGRRSLTPYKPQPLSAPSKVLEHLHEHGGCITYVEIARRFEIPQATITASFKSALKKGALERHVVDGKIALALPGWTPPAPEPEDPELIAARAAQLELAKATLALWQLHAAALKARTAFETMATRLRPLIPTESMPAL